MPVVKDTIVNKEGEEVAIYIEVDQLPQQPRTYYGDLRDQGKEVVAAANDVFSKGMSLIQTCAEQVVTTIQKVDHTVRPTEFEIQLAIKLDSEVGAILAKASAEAQLQVTMRWTKKDE
jgi:hypothetical protein